MFFWSPVMIEHLCKMVSCDLFHVDKGPAATKLRMRNGYHLSILPQRLDHALLMRWWLPQRKIPKTYFLGVDGEIVGFFDIISVFIDRHIDIGFWAFIMTYLMIVGQAGQIISFVDICFNKGFIWVRAMSDSSQALLCPWKLALYAVAGRFSYGLWILSPENGFDSPKL